VPGCTLVVRLALAMALTAEETDELLQLAGYPPLLGLRPRAGGAAPAESWRSPLAGV
jgi:hypothetical protein